MTITSPLTYSHEVTLLRTLQTAELIDIWQQVLHIDIRDELHGYKKIYLYQCDQTKLKFFMPPDIAGSSRLYEALEQFDWYYLPHKWEHSVAVLDLAGCQTVLEVGCGRGAFVEYLRNTFQIDAQGIELNPNALKYGRSRGIPITPIDVQDLAQAKQGYFDAICLFQVLEHVPNPRDFLQALITLVKSGGTIIVSVPNPEAFPKYWQHDILNQPPHHMTRWPRETFAALRELFPVRVLRVRYEPLAAYHIEWYLDIQMARLPKRWAHTAWGGRLRGSMGAILWKSPAIRRLVRGHTFYVCLKKC